MNNKDIVIGYRENVLMYYTIRNQIAWKQRHGLPLLSLPVLLLEVNKKLNLFEEILSGIPDRRSRIVLRCRYALGMSIADTAEVTAMGVNTVMMIVTSALRQLPEALVMS